MTKTTRILAISILSVVAVSCSEEALLPTEAVGSARLQGQVVTTDDLSGSPAGGISVGVVGTGLAAVTDAEGDFSLFGLPAGGATLRFTRELDGIDATLDITEVSSFLLVDLGRGSANARRRGMGRPGNGRAIGHPGQEAEGTVVSFDGTLLTVAGGSGTEWEFTVTEETIIRKGNLTLDSSALVEGARLHVKASLDEARTAVEIKLRGNGDDEEDGEDDGEDDGDSAVTANGLVGEVGETYLIVDTADDRTVRVDVDENTQIKRRGRPIELSDIEIGDRAECMGTRVDDTTILAKKIETPDR